VKKYTHIGSLSQVFKWAAPRGIGKVSFRGTVKLHGTNGGVHVTPEGVVTAQSRNRPLVVGDDNLGFASFVDKNADFFRDVARGQDITYFGEWCGPGIQKGCAIHKLPSRQFVVFTAWKEEAGYIPMCGVDPQWSAPVYLAQPAGYLEIDFQDPASVKKAAEEATLLTERVEFQCPWAAQWDLTGIGEGVVWVPLGGNPPELYFKSKGEKHRATKPKEKGERSTPEVLENVLTFLNFAVTPHRLAQGVEYVEEMGYPLDMTSTSHFLRWFAGDVERECTDNIEASGLTWKLLVKGVNGRALTYWKDAVKQASLVLPTDTGSPSPMQQEK
jgi:hypothetical protein